MDEGLDTGPIVAVERWSLSGKETAPEMELRAAGVGAELIARTVGPWLAGTILARPQETAATTTRPLRREDGRLDPALPVRDLERRVRALDPWPGAYLETSLGRLIVHRAAVVPGDPADPTAVGTIIGVGATLVLRASDGWLHLDEVQPAGGRRMTAAALLRGRPGFAGLRVE
jgi:methionyl-tRNA formyltransferase